MTTGSSLLGNISGNILAGLGGALIGGSAGAAMASNVSLYNQGNDTGEQSASERAADLATRLANAVVQTAAHPVDSLNYALGGIFKAPGSSGSASDTDILTGESRSTSPLSQSRTDLMLQGIRNGLNGILFGEGGGPQSLNPGTVAVTESGAAQAGRSVPVNVAGYGPGNATLASGDQDSKATPSPALPDSPYSPDNVDARVKPPYETNPAHDTTSPLCNPRKTPEPTDAQSAYENGAVRGGMGTWYARGQGGYYQYFSDNAGTVHFSGTIPESKVPSGVMKQFGR